jgi:TonB family protein
MKPNTFQKELARCRTRTRRALGASALGHALLLLWLVLLPKKAVSETPLTEIAYLEPGELEASAGGDPQASAPAEPGSGRAGPDVRYERSQTKADLALEPESPSVVGDRLSTRLAALQNDATLPAEGLAPAAGMGSALGTAATAPTSLGGGGAGPVSLSRGGGGPGAAPVLSLSRGGGGSATAPALVATGTSVTRAETPAPAQDAGVSARRVVAGASLAGPIADRPVLHMARPTYPDWAKKQGVEGSVTLYFVVRPDGGVKENVLVQKTAGFEDFDESARAALLEWRFEPLHGGRTGEQWGTITFHFRLRDS